MKLYATICCFFAIFATLARGQRPIIRGFSMLIGNCADMFLNEKPINIDVQSCANECTRYTGCRGFSFDYMAQNCWLKWGLCDRIKPARLTPVVFYKNEMWGFTAEPGSCPGQLAVPPVFTDVASCASQCRTMANCSGFTYDFEGDVCYLKAHVCPTTLPNDILAVESWVKYFRKDYWVPAALERTRKHLGDGNDDPAATAEYFALHQHQNDQMDLPPPLNSMEQNTTNPLEMVFYDNNNVAMGPQHYPMPVLTENDPWEAYANPSDGSDYVAIPEDGTRILVHRATIANASEATCSRACTLDLHCSYFYLMRSEVTMVLNHKTAETNNETNNQPETTTTIVQTNCVLFAKWNATSSSSTSTSTKRRKQPEEGKLFQKIAHTPHQPHIQHVNVHQSLFEEEPDTDSNIGKPSRHSPITLISLRKRKRGLDEAEMKEVAEEVAAAQQLQPNSSTLTKLSFACLLISSSVVLLLLLAV